ncbi:MAG: peptidylprolyl isomerase [Candidatus Hydrogenedentes bacterium]|nr:peptidylprolyl isomerase [Candidatus Hydrogenedentota bacterium]
MFSPRAHGVYGGIFVFACAVLTLTGAGPAQAELVDAIVATVDTEVILLSDLLTELQGEQERLRESARSETEFERQWDDLLRRALDQMIEAKILYREARLLGVEVSEEEVEERVDSMRKSFDTNEAFMRELEVAGLTLPDYRARERKRIMAQRMSYSKSRALEEEEVVSESEILQYYQEHLEDYSRPERVNIRQIFLQARVGTPERDALRAQLTQLRDDLLAGADFATLAREHSRGPGREQGGTIGWQPRGDLIEVLDHAAFSLEVGEISEVLESRFGLHLVRVDAREEAGAESFDTMRVAIEPLLRAQAAGARYAKWLADLRKRSRVRVFL